MSDSADRPLLLGLLALQTGRIREDQLASALRSWSADKRRPFEECLTALGCLDETQKEELNTLAELHVAAHEGDIEKSLDSIPIGETTRAELAAILGGGDDLGATLAHAGAATTIGAGAARSIGSASAVTLEIRSAGDHGPAPGGPRFQIIRAHAKGGVGAIYVAVDSELHREVALKQILENHADNPTIRSRFLVEAEITGGLEHPGIVPVYGLGSDADGRPYYAMRFIRGETLRDVVEAFHAGPQAEPERSLGFRRLLRKFTDVCNAIDYAHSRGVLHRDIKPANVVVGKHGETLVVDWGLAKALGQSAADSGEETLVPASDDGSALTLAGQAIGTPGYMSPEQARGDLEDLDARSDVYALGATLYHLLTDRAPFQGTAAGALKAARARDFPRPRSVDSSIDPALEAIVLKAMAADPNARYASAKALADDVDRWMADERVEAHREPWTRSLIRWLTRHRTGVTAAAAAGLVALAALGIVSLIQATANIRLAAANTDLAAQRARAEANEAQAIDAAKRLQSANGELAAQRARAERNEAQAIEAVKRFKDAVAGNQELRLNPKLESVRKMLLKEPLTFFGQLRDRLRADHDARPESLFKLAGAAQELARLVNEVGDKQDAIRTHREAIDIFERLAREHPEVAEYRFGLSAGLHDLFLPLQDTGRLDEARTVMDRAVEVCERLGRDYPGAADYQFELADNLEKLSVTLKGLSRAGEARAALDRAIEIGERLVRDHPDIAEYQYKLSSRVSTLGWQLASAGRIDEARAALERAIEIQERVVRDHPSHAEYQAGLALRHAGLGALLGNAGRIDESRAAQERGIAIWERLVRDDPAKDSYQGYLGSSLRDLGNLHLGAGRLDEAQTALERAIEILERAVRDHPNNSEHRFRLARSLGTLARLRRAEGKVDEAQAAYERVVAIGEGLTSGGPTNTNLANEIGDALGNLAALDLQASRFAEARRRSLKAIDWRKNALAVNPSQGGYRRSLENDLARLAQAERGLGNHAEADRAARDLAEFRINDPAAQAIDARLKAVLGGAEPKDAAERLALARRAYMTTRFQAAAKLWADALDADPKLADDRKTQHAYNAACAAALAANGEGADPPADDAEKARLRGRALGWLKAETEIWAKLLESADPQTRAAVAQSLRHWREDPDLASVRDPDALAKLPEAERAAWKTLWDDVAALPAGAE